MTPVKAPDRWNAAAPSGAAPRNGGSGRLSQLGVKSLKVVGALPSPRGLIPTISVVLGAASVVLWAVLSLTGDVSPRSTVGVGFGIAATVALGVVMLYSARRSMPSVRALGRTQKYLEVHLYGGFLFLVLLLLHTSLGLPSGVLTTAVWAVSLWVVATGVVGVMLQRSLPALLEDATSFEAHYHRIPELVAEVRERAEKVAREAGPRVKDFYEREMAQDMTAPRSRIRGLLSRQGAVGLRAADFDVLRSTMSGKSAEAIDDLRDLHQTKLDLDVHYTVQGVLRSWLYLHLPPAVALLGLVALHIFFVLYF